MEFNPGFPITARDNPLGLCYGEGTFGPSVESRSLNEIRASLLNPHCNGPEIVYAIAMDVGRNCDKQTIVDKNLLYGVVTYAKGTLGSEPVRSQGHIHAISKSCNSSTCEVYEIWQGKACIYMQERGEDDAGRCFAVLAQPGEIVIVPPGWVHSTVSADPLQNMSFGAWCVRDFGFVYDGVRAHKGLAWMPMIDEGELTFTLNPHYRTTGACVVKRPRSYSEFSLDCGKPIYTQFSENPERFDFVCKPQLAKERWIEFVP